LVDQACIDIPPEIFGAEAGFWSALTGWERRPGSRPEFEYLVRPAGIPLRLLLQRLDKGGLDDEGGIGDPGGRCRAHLDIACDDLAAERARHEALGAEVVRTIANWTTLRDPANREYCITRRDPITGSLA
jgi:predicted enzyme related to lactoylglutathione lyase